jgi:hypothetical protein
MIRKWNVDDHTVVEARIGSFGRTVLAVNGQPLEGKFTVRKKGERNFELPGGRHASISVKPQFGTRPEIRLSVDGRLMVATGKKPFKCERCAAVVNPNDRFCGKCGREMPSAETFGHRDNINAATRAIAWLAVLFVISGLLMFFVSRGQSEKALTALQGMDAAATYPKQIGGHNYTVGELRKEITWETQSILVVNGILAVIMAALALWSRRSALPAVLIATATYVVVIVYSGIAEPESIGKGVFVKLIVIALLVRGIKAALALRAANA